MQLQCDRATVGLFLSDHDNEIVPIQQDTEVILCDESAVGATDVQSILGFPIGVSIRSNDDLREAVDVAVISFVAVPDFGPVWNTDPFRCRWCLTRLQISHNGPFSL